MVSHLQIPEAIICRFWVRNAILALHNAGAIHLTTAIEIIEQTALETVEGNWAAINQGTDAAMVLTVQGSRLDMRVGNGLIFLSLVVRWISRSSVVQDWLNRRLSTL